MKSTNVTPYISRQFHFLNEFDELTEMKLDCYFDMLNFNVSTVSWSFIKHKCIKLYTFHSSYYGKCRRYKCKTTGVEFSLLTRPINLNNWRCQIQINPRDFETAFDFRKTVEKIAGYRLTENNHEVKRLDIAITGLKISPMVIQYATHTKWKTKSKTFTSADFKKGALTGVRTVSKSMDFSSYSRDKISSYQRKRNCRRGTQIEFQIKGSSIYSLKVSTIDGFLNLDLELLFKRFKFYDIRYSKVKTDKGFELFTNFQLDVLRLGFHQARLKYNKYGHFNRDIGQHMQELSIDNGRLKLIDLLNSSLNNWLKKWKNQSSK